MDPKDFLKTAETLANAELEEPDFRSSVSRAYYAAFLEARKLVSTMATGVSRGVSTHVDIQRMLKSSSANQSRTIGYELSRFHERRKEADYDMEVSAAFNLDDAEHWIGKANRICELIGQCWKDPLYSQVKPSVENWIKVNQNRESN